MKTKGVYLLAFCSLAFFTATAQDNKPRSGRRGPPLGCGLGCSNPCPTFTVTANSATICQGASVTLTATATATINEFTWSPATGLSKTVGASVIASPPSTTTYTVTASHWIIVGTDTTECNKTFTTTVTVNSRPDVTVSPSIAICSGTSTNLIAGGASTYQWSPAAGLTASTGSSVTANGTTTTKYLVTGTGVNSCTDTASVTVTIKSLPPKPVITSSGLGSSTPQLSSSSTTGNQWFRNGSAIAAATDQVLAVTQAGQYTVTVTVNGCVSTSDPVSIIVTGVHEAQLDQAVSVSPNPATTTVRLYGINCEQPFVLTIFDSLGRGVAMSPTPGVDAELDVSQLPPGTFILRVSQGDGVYFVRLQKK